MKAKTSLLAFRAFIVTSLLFLALSACSTDATKPRFSDLEKAEQSLPNVDNVVKREVVNNCQGDSPTGPSIYLFFPLPTDGQVPNERWAQALTTSGWHRSEAEGAFDRKVNAVQVVAVINQTRIGNTYAVVLFLEDGGRVCPMRQH